MEKKPGVRLRDVAQLAQVAESTVSKVLSGKATVSEETRNAIFAAANELGYPYTKKTMAIGILAAGDNPTRSLVPFISDVFHGIELVCQEQEVGLMYSSVPRTDIAAFAQMPIIVRRRQIEGAILINIYDQQFYQLVTQNDLPCVFVSHHVDLPQTDTIVCDDEKGGYLATRYLIDHGHCSPPPAIIGAPPEKSSLYKRYQGYRRALEEAGIPYDERYTWFGDQNGEIRGKEGVRYFFSLPQPPTAIFCCTDLSANAALNMLQELQIQVPEQCSLIGFDDSPQAARGPVPLTTIHAPNEALGMEAARLLLSRLSHRQLPSRRVCLDVTLVERGSVATRSL
ncbi:MAG TPA: LacI family DNA-binding transcriptional regulator [Ktedonobacteraceae bacterium]|nr:LacI family DNA-binding transcriptional regulator [Ktedonobacteraceae bacterium]